MSAQRSVHLSAYVPPIAFLFFTLVAGLLQALVSPTMPVISSTGAARSVADQARFASASFGWAAIAILTVASLVGALAYSGWVVWNSAGSLRAKRCWALWVALIAVASVAADLSGSTPAFWTYAIQSDDFRWPLTRATLFGNALGLASVGGLFFAAGSLIHAYCTAAIAQVVALERLRWLLILGAVATVCGVIEVRAVHQLPGAAITAADMRGARLADTQSLRDALAAEIDSISTLQKFTDAAAAGKLPLLLAAVDESFGESVSKEARSMLRYRFALESQSSQAERSADALAEIIMHSRDESARIALVKQIDDVALHFASFAGALFSVGLALLYLPAAAVLTSPRPPQKGPAAAGVNVSEDRKRGILSNAPLDTPPSPPAAQAAKESQAPKGSKPSAAEPGVKPFSEQLLALTKVLTALAPLLAGLVGEALKSILSVSG